jgi:uncharacterized membrane protein
MAEASQTPQPQPETQKKNTGMAIVAYILFFIPLLTESKNDPFVKYHVKQGLGLFIYVVAVSVLSWILPWYLGWIISLLSLGVFILFIIGVIAASKGEEKPLPLIGKFAEQLKI